MALRALVLRPVLRRPWRFLVTVLGVAAGIASVVSTVAASRAAVNAFVEGIDEVAGAARLELRREGGVPENLLATLRPVTADAVIAPVVDDVTLLVELGDAVRLLGVDVLADQGIRPLLAGRLDASARLDAVLLDGAVLLPRGLAETLGVTPGDRITLSARGRPVRVEVAAIFDPPRAGSAWDRVVVMDVAFAQELLGTIGRLDRIELAPRRGVDADELAAQLRGLVPAGVEVARPSDRREAIEQMLASLRFNLTALSGISLLVGAVLVGTTLATSVVQRRWTLALARSLGASRLQIAGAILAEAVAIGLSGGVLGAFAGQLGAHLAVTSVRATVAAVVRGVPASAVTLDPALLLGAVGLAVVTALAAAALPLVEALRTPPLQGLRGEAPSHLTARSLVTSLTLAGVFAAAAGVLVTLPAWHGLPLAALLAALLLMLVPLALVGPLVEGLSRLGSPAMSRLGGTGVRLAVAALATGRRRAAWAAGAVAVAVALAVAIITLVTSFRATVVAWTEAGMRSDLWVRPVSTATGIPVGRLDPELVRISERLFGRDAVDPFYSTDVEYRGRPVTFAGGAFDVVQHWGGVPFPGRRSEDVFAEALARHGAVVNEPFARRFGVSTGDRIRLELPDGPLEREVIGVFSDYSRSHGLVVIDRADWLARFPGASPQQIALYLGPGGNPDLARRRLREALGGRWLVDVLDNLQLKREVLSAFNRTFAITTALYLVAATVAVVAVATVLLALVGERRRDIALLRSLGGSRAQVAAVVLWQAILLGAAAAATGVAAGLTVGVVLVKVVNLQSFGWSLQLDWPWAELARLGLALAVACLAAGLTPALAASRLEPAEVLRENG